MSPLVLLAVNPGDGDAVPLHPLHNVRITLQAVHHPPFEVALILLEVPGALIRIAYWPCMLIAIFNDPRYHSWDGTDLGIHLPEHFPCEIHLRAFR